MDEKEIEIKILVLEERQRTYSHHLKDVDECCGKLKGRADQEFRALTERVVAVEHEINDNCKDVELELRGTDEKVKSAQENIDTLQENISEIRRTYKSFTISVFASLLLLIIGILMKKPMP